MTNGRFVVTFWDSSENLPDLSGVNTRAQIFNADGSKFGAKYLVNTLTDSVQREASVTGLADGRFVVRRTNLSSTGADTTFAVHAQIFDARDHAINLTGTAGPDSFVGTRFNDTLNGAQGNDILKGGAGNDRISGGLGSDVLTGEIGADVFLFANAAQAGNGAGRDPITDFAHGVDHINFHAVMAGGQLIGSPAFGVGAAIR